MDRRHHKRKLLSQNFLCDRQLVEKIVRQSSIFADDVVYEIGPGRGIITAELARRAAKVIGVERDTAFVRVLRRRFAALENVEIVQGDFLKFHIRETRPFKIFANVPFGITAFVMQKVLYEPPIASEIHFILQREAALKYSGLNGETLVSLFAKPRFQFEIVHRFRRTDFHPVPGVDSVLLKIARRPRPLIEKDEVFAYREFVRLGFCRWRPNLRLALKREFSYKHWKRLARDLHFPLNAKPSELTFDKWLGLFRAFTSKRSEN
jgi:23S rRNA (adenine-N6)-dimethyltransferase